MRPRLGKKNAHHFAHFSSLTPDCNPETYLHKLAKFKIKEKFKSIAPFEIRFRQVSLCSERTSCPFYKKDECQLREYKTYDLHKNYDTCNEEQSIGNYRADLLLTSFTKPETPPILIEILVTHKCEETKINSGEKIIEIRIKNEDDIKRLLQSPITESSKYYMEKDSIECVFYNFKQITDDEKLEIRIISKLYLFNSGLLHLKTYQSCNGSTQKDNSKSILELAIAEPPYNVSLYELGYAKAIEMGYDIRNCHLCKYFKNSIEQNFCCLYKKYSTPQYPKGIEAITCQYFRKDHRNDELLKLALDNTTIVVCK